MEKICFHTFDFYALSGAAASADTSSAGKCNRRFDKIAGNQSRIDRISRRKLFFRRFGQAGERKTV